MCTARAMLRRLRVAVMEEGWMGHSGGRGLLAAWRDAGDPVPSAPSRNAGGSGVFGFG